MFLFSEHPFIWGSLKGKEKKGRNLTMTRSSAHTSPFKKNSRTWFTNTIKITKIIDKYGNIHTIHPCLFTCRSLWSLSRFRAWYLYLERNEIHFTASCIQPFKTFFCKSLCLCWNIKIVINIICTKTQDSWMVK